MLDVGVREEADGRCGSRPGRLPLGDTDDAAALGRLRVGGGAGEPRGEERGTENESQASSHDRSSSPSVRGPVHLDREGAQRARKVAPLCAARGPCQCAPVPAAPSGDRRPRGVSLAGSRERFRRHRGGRGQCRPGGGGVRPRARSRARRWRWRRRRARCAAATPTIAAASCASPSTGPRICAARPRRRARGARLLRGRRALPAPALHGRSPARDRWPHRPRAGRAAHRAVVRDRLLDGAAGHRDGAGGLARRRPGGRHDQVVPRRGDPRQARRRGLSAMWFRAAERPGSRSATTPRWSGSSRTGAAASPGSGCAGPRASRSCRRKAVVLGCGGFEANPEWRGPLPGPAAGTTPRCAARATTPATACAWRSRSARCRTASGPAATPRPSTPTRRLTATAKLTDKTNRLSYPYGCWSTRAASASSTRARTSSSTPTPSSAASSSTSRAASRWQIFDAKVTHLLEGRYQTGTPVTADSLEALVEQAAARPRRVPADARGVQRGGDRRAASIPTVRDGLAHPRAAARQVELGAAARHAALPGLSGDRRDHVHLRRRARERPRAGHEHELGGHPGPLRLRGDGGRALPRQLSRAAPGSCRAPCSAASRARRRPPSERHPGSWSGVGLDGSPGSRRRGPVQSSEPRRLRGPRPRRAARPTPSPTRGGAPAPGSRASTPISRPRPRASCWPAATSSTTSWRRPTSPTSGSPRYRALLVPNAAHLAAGPSSASSAGSRDPARRLIVTGKTNLPPRLLGLAACAPLPVEGYTGWRWRPDSPFGGAGLGAALRERLRRATRSSGSRPRRAAASWPSWSSSPGI